MAAKTQVRKEISKLLEGLSQLEKEQQSGLVFKKVIAHPKYRQASRVSIYLSTNNEINTKQLLRQALEVDKKRCYVPLVLRNSTKEDAEIKSHTRMVMYELRSMAEYEQLPVNHYGIKEPKQVEDPSSRIASSLDLVVTPGVAFDLAGRRLGHGKGYYDEFFSYWASGERNSDTLYSIGVAFKEQILPEGELPFIEGRDFRLNEVLGPSGAGQ